MWIVARISVWDIDYQIICTTPWQLRLTIIYIQWLYARPADLIQYINLVVRSKRLPAHGWTAPMSARPVSDDIIVQQWSYSGVDYIVGSGARALCTRTRHEIKRDLSMHYSALRWTCLSIWYRKYVGRTTFYTFVPVLWSAVPFGLSLTGSWLFMQLSTLWNGGFPDVMNAGTLPVDIVPYVGSSCITRCREF